MSSQNFDLKNFLLSKINRKITLLFIIVALVAPAFGIYYFYTITVSSFSGPVTDEQAALLRTVALMIMVLIAADAGIIGFFVSRSISKPIKELYKATREIEKGNYNIKLNLTTNDEISELGNAFNVTTAALAKMDQERREIDVAKTEFLSITSHELRSPMTPMKAQLQMLQQGYFGNLSDKQKESLEIIVRNADRLDKIIVDFLEISRIEAARLKFNFVETNLAQMVKDTVIFMEGFAKEKQIDLILDVKDIPKIEADPDRISQVLRNLINNAIKFSKEKSKIEIKAELKEDKIQFSVQDYGIGLSPENQIRVFEPFYQVENANRRKHGGTGLGLTICRGIVEAQKGKIWVESVLGKGSKFYFTVPLKPVRNIEPIKVLFSPRGVIENKICDEFRLVLGPLGEAEFLELKNKNSINIDDLHSYIDFLVKEFIIPNERGSDFKEKIDNIFGHEKENKNDKNNKFGNDLGEEVFKRG